MAKLVQQHKCGAALDVEIPAELKRAMPLGIDREDRDRHQVRAEGELPAREDRARRHAELVEASFALPDPAGTQRIDRVALASRTGRLSAVVGPSKAL